MWSTQNPTDLLAALDDAQPHALVTAPQVMLLKVGGLLVYRAAM